MILRRLLLLTLLVLCPSILRAQSTLVSGTVTDTGGQAWINGTYTFKSQALGQSAISGNLDSTGSYSVSIPHTPATSLVSDTWQLNVCPAFTSGCYNSNPITIVQQTQTLNVTPKAITISVPSTPQQVTPVQAYSDSEITGGWPGFVYWNVTNTSSRQCVTLSGGVCTWAQVSNSSGTATFSNINQILLVDGVKYPTIDAAIAAVPSFNNVAATGCVETGNSVTCTTTAPHGFSVNQTVFVIGVTNNGFNGEFPLASVTSLTYTYLNCVVPQGGGQGCITGLGTSGGGTVAPAAHIIIPPNYLGAEVATCSNLDNAGNAMGGFFSVTPANIHIEDRRGTSKCAYNASWNSNGLQSNPNNLAIWRRDTSPNITSSNITTDMQITGIIPGGQALAGGTFEVDTIGNVSTPSGVPFIQATNGQWAVRSLGGTITQIMGGSGGGGIDRTYATSNIVQASGLFAFDPKNISSAGATILESYGLVASNPASGTRNNYAIFSQGNQVFSDNFGVDVMNGAYSLPAGATGQKLLRFGGDNSQATAGVSQYSTTNFAGVPYHFIYTPGTVSNWMIGAQLNNTNSFEVTPSTAAGGTTFSTPGIRVFNNGSGGASTLLVDTGGIQTNGTIRNAAGTTTMGVTLKKGSGAGNYTNATTTYTVADSTNLCFTVTIPTGWKLSIVVNGAIGTATGAVNANLALTDNAACSTANAGILVETTETTTAAGVLQPIGLSWVVTGDGAAHNIALQFKTSNAADSATLLNASATQLPTMVFTLMPSN